MTDNEIIKALEYCVSVNSCDDCEKPTPRICTTFETKGFLDLINRKQAEINKLKYQVNRLKGIDKRRDIDLHSMLIANTRAETIKEVAESFKAKIRDVAKIDFQGGYYYLIGEAFIDNLAEELTEQKLKEMRVDNAE